MFVCLCLFVGCELRVCPYCVYSRFMLTMLFDVCFPPGNGGTSTATVTVTVIGVNDAPVANNDSAYTPEDTPVNIEVLLNDEDPDGNDLVVTGATNGASGTTVVNSDGTITYTPNPNFSGVDTFTYTISDGE